MRARNKVPVIKINYNFQIMKKSGKVLSFCFYVKYAMLKSEE